MLCLVNLECGPPTLPINPLLLPLQERSISSVNDGYKAFWYHQMNHTGGRCLNLFVLIVWINDIVKTSLSYKYPFWVPRPKRRRSFLQNFILGERISAMSFFEACIVLCQIEVSLKLDFRKLLEKLTLSYYIDYLLLFPPSC